MIYFKQKYARNTHALHPGYILAPPNTPTFLWSNRSTLGHALRAALPDIPIQQISTVSSFPGLMQVVTSSENDRT